MFVNINISMSIEYIPVHVKNIIILAFFIVTIIDLT